MKTISIVIPNYNGEQILKKNLPEVLRLAKWQEVVEFIIVDDNSGDNSASLIKTEYKKVRLIQKKHNTGFSDSVNLGIASAKGELVFLINTDIRPAIDTIPHLLPYFDDQKTFAAGCLDNSVEENKIIERGRGVGIFSKGFLTHKKGDINSNNTLWVSGGSAIYNKSIWLKLGGLDSVYDPFYWEDVDISYRALKSGYRIFFVQKARVIHDHKSGSILTNYNKETVKEIAQRNQILFVWKNISDIRYLLEHILYLIFFLLKAVIKNDQVFIKSFVMALKKLSIAIKHRNKESKLWIKTDREILVQFETEFAK